MSGEILAIIILGIAVIVLILVLIFRRTQDYSQAFFLLQQRIGQVEEQVRKGLEEGNRSLTERFENSLRVIGEIKKTIGSLEETNKQMLAISKDIASVQDLLRPPQIRGYLGELTLSNILREILPRQHFEEQYRFKNGSIVDAIIKIGDRIVPVDAKFPLDSFGRFISCTDEKEKSGHLREFCRSVKNKIDDISAKYIIPDELTFDFALMYIPSENVYYQTILKEELILDGKSIAEYALEKHVVIVSPNSLYAYLRVICLGLRGMQFENNVRRIIDDYNRLNKELEKFEKVFSTLGSHINHASATFDSAAKQLNLIAGKLAMAGESSQFLEDGTDRRA